MTRPKVTQNDISTESALALTAIAARLYPSLNLHPDIDREATAVNLAWGLYLKVVEKLAAEANAELERIERMAGAVAKGGDS